MLNIQEIHVKEIITKSKLPDADYVINPYVGCPNRCIYCYAEFMKRFTNHKEQWGQFIDVKIYEKKLNLKALKDETILISSVTDPYNPYEAKYNLTRDILSQLVDSEAKVEILTKSKLVLRDLNLIKKFKNIKVGISFNSLDDNFRRQTEPLASRVEDRLEVLRVLHEENIQTYLFVSPMFPKITDFKEIVGRVGNLVDCYCFENLNLRGEYKARVLKYISEFKPELYNLYLDIYCNGKNRVYWEEIKHDIENEFAKNGLNYKLYFYHEDIKKK